jgi:hypothetical protein
MRAHQNLGSTERDFSRKKKGRKIPMSKTDLEDTQAKNHPQKLQEHQGKGWTMIDGKVSTSGQGSQFKEDGAEDLSYNNPFSQIVERAWFDGKVVYAIEGEEMHLSPNDQLKVAGEYQPVFSVELDENGWVKNRKSVPGQLNIYDSVPGMKEYSAIWKFYYVIVPEDYQPNSLRSVEDCKKSRYEIRESNYYQN